MIHSFIHETIFLDEERTLPKRKKNNFLDIKEYKFHLWDRAKEKKLFVKNEKKLLKFIASRHALHTYIQLDMLLKR